MPTPVRADQLAAQRSMVVAFLRRHVRDPHLVEDLTQETLLRGFRRLHHLREPDALARWLRQIAYHIAMDWHRRPLQPEPTGQALEATLAAPEDDPGEPVRLRIWSGRLRGALGALAPRDRMLVIAHYFVGLSCRELAARCGLSHANVKVRLYRSRQQLRRHLPVENDEERRSPASACA